MRLGEAFTALLSTAEKRRNRFVSADERELIDACEARRAHREAERLERIERDLDAIRKEVTL
ncbi:MAG: hypothetical protein KA312_01125 [Sphingorhabdus sp.]|nr:hypothetical protein [Sphingorhabdus sp.]